MTELFSPFVVGFFGVAFVFALVAFFKALSWFSGVEKRFAAACRIRRRENE